MTTTGGPCTAVGRITTARITPGTRLRVELAETDRGLRMMPTRIKRGTTVVTVVSIARAPGGYTMVGRIDSDPREAMGYGAGAQTWTLAP